MSANVRRGLRSAVLDLVGASCNAVGYRPPWEHSGITVFVFHDVTASPSPFEERHGLSLTPNRFRSLAAWISRYYEVITPNDLDRSPSAPACIVTFDDGFSGALSEGVACLRELGLPAVFFLNLGVASGEINAAAAADCLSIRAGTAGTSISPAMVTPQSLVAAQRSSGIMLTYDELAHHQGRYASTSDIAELGGQPGLSFGNHLWNHWATRALSPVDLRATFVRNQEGLARFKSSIPWFAPTSGRISTEQQALVQSLGARRVLAGVGPPNRDSRSPVLHRVDPGGGRVTTHRLRGASVASPLRHAIGST